LYAVAIFFGIFTVAFGLVSVVTGRSLLGWIGVIGFPSVLARLLFSSLIVGKGVFRVMARGGTGSVGDWWGSRRRGGIVLAIVCALTLFATADHPSRPGSAPPPRKPMAAQMARFDSGSGTLVADLPAGGQVELLAIGPPDGAPNSWWRSNGKPIRNATYEVREGVEPTNARARVSKDLLVRTIELPEGVVPVGLESDPSAPSGSGGQVWRDGELLKGAYQVRVAWKPTTREATLRLGFGLPTWRNIATQSVDGHSTQEARSSGDPRWKVNFHREPLDINGEAQTAVVFGPADRLWNHRLVAVDTNGVGHLASRVSGTPVEKLTWWTYTFRDLPLKAVREFRLEIQPVHWVEFANLKLNPLPPTPTSNSRQR
jgi:hypothetical protein